MNIRVLYFAALAGATGCDAETMHTSSGNAAALFDEIAARYRLPFARQHLRVAINGAFASWGQCLNEGDEVALLPPVSGG